MKLTHLLAQFLYTNKRLDLQGIGTFSMEGYVEIDTDKNKSGKLVNAEGISFQYNPKAKEDRELIAFLSTHTGKIKALMSADLNSHLDLAKEFLNIGKPFLFDGIGSLVKLQTGEYSFSPGHLLTEKLSEQAQPDLSAEAVLDEPVTDYKDVLYGQQKVKSWKKPLLSLFILAGVALAVWGGYYVYKRTAKGKESTVVADNGKDKTILLEDTVANNVTKGNNLSVNAEGKTKFIIEIADSARAMQRYGRLKTFQWDVQMETKDSQTFKLFLLLPIAPADTTKVIDSLTRLNGRKVYVEN